MLRDLLSGTRTVELELFARPHNDPVIRISSKYEEVLKKAGFFVQESQRSIFEEPEQGKNVKNKKNK